MKGNKTDKFPIKNPKRNSKEKLPDCMKAPSAEHARAHDYDEPCNDGRGGEIADK